MDLKDEEGWYLASGIAENPDTEEHMEFSIKVKATGISHARERVREAVALHLQMNVQTFLTVVPVVVISR